MSLPVHLFLLPGQSHILKKLLLKLLYQQRKILCVSFLSSSYHLRWAGKRQGTGRGGTGKRWGQRSLDYNWLKKLVSLKGWYREQVDGHQKELVNLQGVRSVIDCYKHWS